MSKFYKQSKRVMVNPISKKLLILSLILFTLSCSSNQNNKIYKSQNLPLQPVNQNFGMSDLETKEQIKNSNWKTIKAEKISNEIIFQDRNMSLYDKEITSDYKCISYKCIEGKMRSFIWNHWKDKKRGYIEYYLQGIDLSITEHIFIEPTENGEWKVVWKVYTYRFEDSKFVEATGIVEMDENKQKLVYKSSNGNILKEL